MRYLIVLVLFLVGCAPYAAQPYPTPRDAYGLPCYYGCERPTVTCQTRPDMMGGSVTTCR